MKITYTSISRFIKSCIFNPRLNGPLKIISEIDNPDYYENRAIEFIREAQQHLRIQEEMKKLDSNFIIDLKQYDDIIIKTIQLLALSRETRHNSFKEINKEIKGL
jgi:hypothetical protein